MGGHLFSGFTGSNRDNYADNRARLEAERAAAQQAAENAVAVAAAKTAEEKRVAEAKTAADAKVYQDVANKRTWDLKLGKGKKKSAGGSARTDYHTGLGETQQADIASKSLLGQ